MILTKKRIRNINTLKGLISEGDKFFVYVVSGLKKGMTPQIQIIQNPVKYLMPDPPYKKSFSDWKNGVVKVVKCQKV